MTRKPELPPTLADAFRQARAEYAAAKPSRFRRTRTGLVLTGSGADYHFDQNQYLRVIEYARDMDRNDAVIGQLLDRATLSTLQDGFSLDPQTGDAGLDEDLWQRWHAWANDPYECDVGARFAFPDFETLALRSSFLDGDDFFLPRDDGRLQMVEGHRCRTPTQTSRNVVLGVLIDDDRKPLEYWFAKDDINPRESLRLVGDVVRYPARDRDGEPLVFHIFDPKRCSQTRGASALAPVFDLSGMFDDLNFAKLVQAQISSCIAIFHQLSEQANPIPSDARTGPEEEDAMTDQRTRILKGIAPGLEIFGKPGETLSGFSPDVPNEQFFEHVKFILRLIGGALGVPLIELLLDSSETNFSGWRGADNKAAMRRKYNQGWLIRRFHSPVYRWKVRGWLATDPILAVRAAALGDAIYKHQWNPPTQRYMQPEVEAAADALQVEKMITSPRRKKAERGMEHQTIVDETVEDNAYAIEAAIAKSKELGAKLGVELDPRQFLCVNPALPLTVAPPPEPAPSPAGGTQNEAV